MRRGGSHLVWRRPQHAKRRGREATATRRSRDRWCESGRWGSSAIARIPARRGLRTPRGCTGSLGFRNACGPLSRLGSTALCQFPPLSGRVSTVLAANFDAGSAVVSTPPAAARVTDVSTELNISMPITDKGWTLVGYGALARARPRARLQGDETVSFFNIMVGVWLFVFGPLSGLFG